MKCPCSRIKIDDSSTLEAGAQKQDLAAYASVWHSNQNDIGVRSSAFKATDRDSRVTVTTYPWTLLAMRKLQYVSR